MNYILEYWEAIESGKVVTSRRVRAVYERLAREIREPDPASPYSVSYTHLTLPTN